MGEGGRRGRTIMPAKKSSVSIQFWKAYLYGILRWCARHASTSTSSARHACESTTASRAWSGSLPLGQPTSSP